MAVAPDTITGTITLTSGSAAFTTAGTNMLTRGHKPGDTIHRNGFVLVIDTITGENIGTLTENCPAAAAGAAVAVRIRFQPDGSRVAAQARNLIDALADLPSRLIAPDNANSGKFYLPEATANGANKIIHEAAAALTADRTITWPDIDYTDAMDLLKRWTRATAAGPAKLAFAEDTDNGTNLGLLQGPPSLTGDRSWVMPDADMTIHAYMAGLLNTANAPALLAAIGAQASDADLAAIAGLSTTSFGRALLTAADRGTLLTLGNVMYDLGNIADDTSVSVNVGTAAEGATYILQFNTNTCVIFSARAAATASGCLLVAKTTTAWTVTLAAASAFYAGTTGTDGQLSVGAHSSGVISVENRTGGTVPAQLFVFKKSG